MDQDVNMGFGAPKLRNKWESYIKSHTWL